MSTNYLKAPLSNYAIHEVAEGVNGYNYYLLIHPQGQVVIQRENVAGTQYRYADGGFNPESAWANKEDLTYKSYNELG